MKKVKRLFSEFRPEHYELFLEPNREKANFSGRVTISGRKIGRPSHRITLHQKDLRIKSAIITMFDKKSGTSRVDVDRINTHKSFDELRLHSKQMLYPGEYKIELEFSGKVTEPMHGIYPCNFEIDGDKKQLIATQFESHHAREAFPCVDEPEAKATFTLSLLTEAGETAVSNMPIKIQSERDGKLLTEFEKSPKMSSYLLAFVYGELDFKESQTKKGVAVRVYATKDKVKLTDFALDTAVKTLEFLEEYYGIEYPLPKLDLAGLPDFSAGAMENWGIITFRESVLFFDPNSSSIETKQYVAIVIAHELAHQWFGNLVTMKWWDDLWLNESFANFMEYYVVDKLFPEWNMWQDFTQREFSSALTRDSLPNVQPIQVEVNHPDEIMSLFDPSIVYAKGSVIVNMVMRLIGDDNFRAGLKSYFEEFQYSNSTADDLWRHFEEASHIKIREIMKNWLQKPGFPVVAVSYHPKDEAFNVSQERLVVSSTALADKTTWQIPLASSLSVSESIFKNREDKFLIKEGAEYPLVLNHDGHSYFVAQYIEDNHFEAILKAAGNGSLSAIDRLLLLQNYMLLERAGRVATVENIKFLKAYANDREVTIWGLLAGIIGNINNLIGTDQTLEDKLHEFVRPLAMPMVAELSWIEHKDESSKTHKLRSLALDLAAASETPDVIKEGLKKFKSFKQPSDLSPDIRQTVYFIAVRYGTKENFSQLVELYNSLNNADEKEEIAAELTVARDPKQIAKLLEMVLSGQVRPQDVSHWYAWLLRNRYATDTTWQWLKDNWHWIEEKFGSDKSYDYFIRYTGMVFSRPQQLEDFNKFFQDKSNLAIARPIKLAVEEIEGRIAWRQKNEQPVKDWLNGL